MADFMIRFLLCNLFISAIIGILLAAKHLFKNDLSNRMQYNLWFLFLGLLAIPFTPLRPIGFWQIFPWLKSLCTFPVSNPTTALTKIAGTPPIQAVNLLNDFALSVNSTASTAGLILFAIWIAGILVMLLLTLKSHLHLHTLKKSSLPLQNPRVHNLYRLCLQETGITKPIPVYSTAFLKSPIIVGFLKPCIYLPIHLISDYKESDMRYMLLHELQHYKHRDALANYLINLAGIIYWFNPFVFYALKEMRNDREVACDTSVLNLLSEDCYEDYGNTLINFAEKISLTSFPFAAGLGGNSKQMKRRIINIASYEKPSFQKRIRGMAAFGLIIALLLGLAPILSTYAADTHHYQWTPSTKNISYIDLSAYLGEYDGCFVLYDLENDSWNIHDLEQATLRTAPDSTYKIYDALFGLEERIITPDNSLIAWDKETYPFEAWNADQTLQSAMDSSVNWYFQAIDMQLGKPLIHDYIQEIGYGNENINGNPSTYWLESSLEISPIEQVELLIRLRDNSFDFAPENINAVIDSIRISSSENGNFYGKTGTGRVDGQNVNGWFIGFIETHSNTYFFATNIQSKQNAAGSNATEITMSILSDLNIWK